jgi:hypothetical protein
VIVVTLFLGQNSSGIYLVFSLELVFPLSEVGPCELAKFRRIGMLWCLVCN